MKGNRKYIIVLALTLALAVFAEASAPRPIDWSPSYSRNHKTPYGALALFEMFVETMPAGSVRMNDLPAYNTLPELDDSARNYIVFNDAFEPDELDRDEILNFVGRGNTAFIAASELGEDFLDELGIETASRSVVFQGGLNEFMRRDTVLMNFVNPALRSAEPYPIRVGHNAHWFTNLDSARTTILGTDADDHANFIRIERGDGAIYLSTLSRAFTNFNVLSDQGREYAFTMLSYLPEQATIWDEYYKSGRRVSSSPLRFVLSNNALRWSWFAVLIGVVLFVFVYARRRQRAIPIVTPPSNTTLEFADTVGRLYFQHGDHRGIAAKKVAFFHEYMRSHLGIRVTDAEHDMYQRIADRSGVAEDHVRSMFSRISHMKRTHVFDADDLKGLNTALEKFYADTKR